MRHVNLEFEYGGNNNTFTFVTLSDLHCGGLIDEKLLSSAVSYIANNDNVYWFGGGDMIEAINKKDKRFEPEAIASWVSLKDPIGSEIEYVVEKLRPIREKCLGLIEGNHEFAATQMWERDVHQNICTNLNVTSLGPRATFNLIFRRGNLQKKGGVVTFPGLIAHGSNSGGGGSKGNEEKTLREPLEAFDTYSGARIILMGHTHDVNALLINRIFLEKSGPYGKICLAARMGSFLQYTPYAQRVGYRPLRPNYLKFYIKPYSDEILLNKDGRS